LEDLSVSKDSLDELKSKLEEHKNSLIISEETNIKYNLSITLIDKLSQMVNELSNSHNDLHKHVSTLRYTLETLIVTKLLLAEDDYFAKIYFSIYKQQENKIKQMIQRLKNEIQILKNYSEENSKHNAQNRSKYTSDFKKIAEENEKIFQFLKNKAQSEIPIFMNQLEEFGFEALSIMLEKSTLVEYENKLKEFEELTLKKQKQLAKEEWFKQYFGVRVQHTQVFKLLKDDRTWEEKAKLVELDKEYSLNYEMTSSLLHFTSYSLSTPNIAKEDEIKYNYMLINQYIKQITTNISAFSKVMIYDMFKVIKV
jgi:ribosome-binding factor A